MTDAYAPIIRILGRGPTNSRHLTREEAHFAFTGVLTGEMADMQVGALLLLLRYRSESPEELAGIVSAIRDHISPDHISPDRISPDHISPDHISLGKSTSNQDVIDWPSYSSGKSRRLPWFLLSAKLLAENGLKVFMHGFNSHLENGLVTEDCLAAVDEIPATSLAEAEQKLQQDNFAYLPLRHFCPKLQELIQIRSVLGVRSIVNTAVKLVNPLAAKMIFLGIFHPPYIELNVGAGTLLNQPRFGVIKGGGGEAERNILKSIKLYQIDPDHKQDQEQITHWPSVKLKNPNRDYPVTVDYLKDIWQGKIHNEYASAMIVGTTAQALYLSGRAATVDQAENLAADHWTIHLNQGMKK